MAWHGCSCSPRMQVRERENGSPPVQEWCARDRAPLQFFALWLAFDLVLAVLLTKFRVKDFQAHALEPASEETRI